MGFSPWFLDCWPVRPSFAAAEVVFGASLPLTGGLAINGQKHKEAYELCIDLLNQSGGLLGEPASVIISDNQSTNETGQAQIERLINQDKVSVLLGTFSSRITFAQTSVAEQNKMLYPIPSGVALQIYERGYKYIFNFQPNAAEYLGKSYTGLMKDLVEARPDAQEGGGRLRRRFLRQRGGRRPDRQEARDRRHRQGDRPRARRARRGRHRGRASSSNGRRRAFPTGSRSPTR